MAKDKKVTTKILPLINLLLVLVIFGALAYGGYKIYQILNFKPEISEEKIELKENTARDKILKSTHYGVSVSTKEPSGRIDPFAPY